MNAPAGQPVWLYSIIYNLSYIVPSCIISIIVALLVLPVLEFAVPSYDHAAAAAA
jgi:thiamine transporter ThiT